MNRKLSGLLLVSTILVVVPTEASPKPRAPEISGAIGGCRQSQQCSTPACALSISCGASQCASVRCGTDGCEVDCRDSGFKLGLDAVIAMTFANLNFEGFLAWVESLDPEWSVTTVVKPDAGIRVDGEFIPTGSTAKTTREAVKQLAGRYGVCVTVSDSTKVISFVECPSEGKQH